MFVLRLQWAKKLGWLFLAVGGRSSMREWHLTATVGDLRWHWVWDLYGIYIYIWELPSGKHTKSYWKSPFIVDFPINSMVIFHSYFDITRGYQPSRIWCENHHNSLEAPRIIHILRQNNKLSSRALKHRWFFDRGISPTLGSLGSGGFHVALLVALLFQAHGQLARNEFGQMTCEAISGFPRIFRVSMGFKRSNPPLNITK